MCACVTPWLSVSSLFQVSSDQFININCINNVKNTHIFLDSSCDAVCPDQGLFFRADPDSKAEKELTSGVSMEAFVISLNSTVHPHGVKLQRYLLAVLPDSSVR